ncbi:MAG: Asp-tRNA(Asn)/Glu-tRNA(Gln) amidotransferase subunit GatC [Candidatus Colwellbacteria bacterium]|nr:Asp-tRNA(Asn)/Glu-tRNA(Gln) amidotransferase subunit GatC [Candidatus Colwellbacteria bacterium]
MDKAINKEKIEHLAGLARIRISSGEEEKLTRDAENIIAYFDELRLVDTEGVEPMIGGTDKFNGVGEDSRDEELLMDGSSAFPRSRDGFLEVPTVMKGNKSDL